MSVTVGVVVTGALLIGGDGDKLVADYEDGESSDLSLSVSLSSHFHQ